MQSIYSSIVELEVVLNCNPSFTLGSEVTGTVVRSILSSVVAQEGIPWLSRIIL